LWRVDRDHANAFQAWQTMGAPQSPNATQYAQLEEASTLVAEPLAQRSRRGSVDLDVLLPRQGVALIVVAAAPR